MDTYISYFLGLPTFMKLFVFCYFERFWLNGCDFHNHKGNRPVEMKYDLISTSSVVLEDDVERWKSCLKWWWSAKAYVTVQFVSRRGSICFSIIGLRQGDWIRMFAFLVCEWRNNVLMPLGGMCFIEFLQEAKILLNCGRFYVAVVQHGREFANFQATDPGD